MMQMEVFIAVIQMIHVAQLRRLRMPISLALLAPSVRPGLEHAPIKANMILQETI
jgi:hypothetical protein